MTTRTSSTLASFFLWPGPAAGSGANSSSASPPPTQKRGGIPPDEPFLTFRRGRSHLEAASLPDEDREPSHKCVCLKHESALWNLPGGRVTQNPVQMP